MVKPVSINSVEPGSVVDGVGEARAAQAPAVGQPTRATGPDFGDTLASAIKGVDQLQLAADEEATKAALGAGNLHELSLALEKADVAMRVATKVRNKVVEAYHEIMRMSV